VESLKIYHINILAIILIAVFNLITCITKQFSIDKYIFYVIPFFIMAGIYILFKNYKIDALLFITASPLSIFIGTWGNLTGAIFLCFAFYCLEDKKIIIISLFFTLLCIFLKMLFDSNGTIPRTFNYIIGYGYILIMYFILIHPKKYGKLPTLNEDEINIKIIEMLISGSRIKEIADKVYLSQNAVTKRIEKMRMKYSCGNNEQMIYFLVKNGKIRLN